MRKGIEKGETMFRGCDLRLTSLLSVTSGEVRFDSFDAALRTCLHLIVSGFYVPE